MLEVNKATKAKTELCNFGYNRWAEANAEVIGWILWRPSLCGLINLRSKAEKDACRNSRTDRALAKFA
jgi:hypothetical protein